MHVGIFEFLSSSGNVSFLSPETFSAWKPVSGKPFYAVRGDELIISSEATWQCSGSPRRCHVKTALLRQKPNVSLFEDFLNLKPKFFFIFENVVAVVHCSAWRQVSFSKGSLGVRFLWTTSSTTKGFMAWWQDGRMRDESWKYSSSNTTLSWLSWSKIRLGPCHCRIWNLRSLPFVQIPRLHCLQRFVFADSCRNTWCDCIPRAKKSPATTLDVPTAVVQLGTTTV